MNMPHSKKLLQGLGSSPPAPQFSVAPSSGRRLLQSPSGVQAAVNINAPSNSIEAAEAAIRNAVQSGTFANTVRASGGLLASLCYVQEPFAFQIQPGRLHAQANALQAWECTCQWDPPSSFPTRCRPASQLRDFEWLPGEPLAATTEPCAGARTQRRRVVGGRDCRRHRWRYCCRRDCT